VSLQGREAAEASREAEPEDSTGPCQGSASQTKCTVGYTV
jgi:hypothetical protein